MATSDEERMGGVVAGSGHIGEAMIDMLTEQERDKLNELIAAYGNARLATGFDMARYRNFDALIGASNSAKQRLVDYVSGIVVAQIDGITP